MEPNNNDFGKTIRNIGLFLGIPLLIFLVLWLVVDNNTSTNQRQYSDYIAYFTEDKVEKFELNLGNGRLTLSLRPGYIEEDTNRDGKLDEKDVIQYQVPDVSLFLDDVRPIIKEMRETNPDYSIQYNYQEASQLPG